MTDHDLLEQAIRESPVLTPILNAWPTVQLPDAWLVAGAVAQSVWNSLSGKAADHGLRDIDIIYHDPDDLTAESETAHEQRLVKLLPDTSARLDVKNEARVHCWYAAKFGYAIPPYPSSAAAIATFPTTATSIGIRPSGDRLEVLAPFGIADLCRLIVRPNRVQITREIYHAKVARWQTLWPDLTILPWQ
ncbi:MAG: nucleotidyltransferase family protein [Minwuia sp.]|nr:nucleotidyltransferase family protein [Minwuia sp.]